MKIKLILTLYMMCFAQLSICAQNKCALITGVSRGIGFALAKELLNQEISVVGVARADCSAVEELYSYPHFSYLSLDLTQKDDLIKLKSVIQRNALRFDYIVHNAATLGSMKSIEDASLDDLEKTMMLNLIAPIQLSHILIPFCKTYARILNITSRAAENPVDQIGTYCISKAGLNMLTLILRRELANKNIAVAAVIPGEVDTQMQIFARETEGFQLKELFMNNYKNNLLIPTALCAQFLLWLLCQTSFDEFNSGSKPWNIYDESHHRKWLKTLMPVSPF